MSKSPVSPCEYELDGYEMADGRFLSGTLYIEVCHWNDDEIYIDTVNLEVFNEDGEQIAVLSGGREEPAIKAIVTIIEADSKQMDFIWDEAMEAAEY